MAEQFLTNRMSDATYLKDVDDRYQDLEDAFVYFFGLPVDQILQGRIFYSNIDGNITTILRQAAAPTTLYTTGPGWRSRDTDNDDEYLIGVQDGYLKIFKNNGSQVSPIWSLKNKMNLDDGAWDVVSSSDVGTGCAVYQSYGSVDFRTPTFMPWGYELYDDGDYWDSGDRTKLVIPANGRYGINWSGFHTLGSENVWYVEVMTTLYLNGSPVVVFGSGQKEEIDLVNPPYKPGVGVGGTWVFDALEAGDYLQFQFQIWSYDDQAQIISQCHTTIERIA